MQRLFSSYFWENNCCCKRTREQDAQTDAFQRARTYFKKEKYLTHHKMTSGEMNIQTDSPSYTQRLKMGFKEFQEEEQTEGVKFDDNCERRVYSDTTSQVDNRL